MEIEHPRSALRTVLRAAAANVIERVVAEAAAACGGSETDVLAYQALAARWMSPVLDAVAASDAGRTRVLTQLASARIDGTRALPPVARLGLVEIAIRLARSEVVRECALRPDRLAIEREFELLADHVRDALLSAVPERDRLVSRTRSVATSALATN